MDSLDLYASNSCPFFGPTAYTFTARTAGSVSIPSPGLAHLQRRTLPPSRFRGVGRPTPGRNAELLGVLRVQPMPAAERCETRVSECVSTCTRPKQNRRGPVRREPRDPLSTRKVLIDTGAMGLTNKRPYAMNMAIPPITRLMGTKLYSPRTM